MNSISKKAHIIHIILIVLAIVLGAAVIKEFFLNGKDWFGKGICSKKPADSCLEDEIKVEYEDDMLVIRIPKQKLTEETKPKKAQII
jgi:hypothetical protein